MKIKEGCGVLISSPRGIDVVLNDDILDEITVMCVQIIMPLKSIQALERCKVNFDGRMAISEKGRHNIHWWLVGLKSLSLGLSEKRGL